MIKPGRIEAVGEVAELPQRDTEKHTHDSFAIATGAFDSDTATARTYRQLITSYLTHPDAKRLAPNGERCTRETTGALEARHVDAYRKEFIGKGFSPLAKEH